MTTTAYDMHFIASDIAFTRDLIDEVTLDIPFRKVKRVGDAVFGMAGCLNCMIDFSEMVYQYISKVIPEFEMPASILNRLDRDFIVMVYLNGLCLKVSKNKNANEVIVENITQIPTVIGSGSKYVGSMINDCPNAIVAVLEAIKHDKYTDGDVKYCSIRRDDIHNLEIHPMSKLTLQLTGMKSELDAVNDFLAKPENTGKAFHASTEVVHASSPAAIPTNLGMQILKDGFASIRDRK